MSQRSRPLVVSLLPLMLAVVPGRAHAAPHLTGRAIVRQGTTEFTIAPLRGSRSVAAFYSYDFPASSCANTGLETTSTSLLFLYEDTTVFPRSLGLVVIHDLPGNPAGGYAEFAFSGLPAASRYVVQDDSDGPYTPDPPAGGQTDATWSWSPCCTDGAAFDGLDTAPFCIAIQPTFTSGIASWQVLDGPDTFTPNRIPLPTLTDTTWICGDCQNLVCPGRVLVGCASGGIAHADVVAVATSLCGGEIVSNDRTAGGADASGDYPVGTTTVTFTLKDAAGFMSTCTTDVVVQDGTPLVVAACPAPLTLDCAGPGGVPVSDPRVQAWLSGFVATGGCPPLTLENDAPALLPSACTANLTTVTFVARDATGATAQCTSSVTALAQCFAPPADVGDALRVGMHGDPHAASITARLDWSLDAGLPRAPGEHYHVLRGASPIALADIPGIEPWPALTLDESTPAFVALPGVHYYVILAASPCEDLSTD